MEYVQERITTLHDLGGQPPAPPTNQVAVVVPMTEREFATRATERMMATLESAGPARVVIALRAGPDRIAAFRDWLQTFELDLTILWCSGPQVHDLLATNGLDGEAGKGRDVWLALGIAAANHPYVVCHDADTDSYTGDHLARLAAPLTQDFSFTKAYYARVENNRLYGRLFRLFYAPLVRALQESNTGAILDYLAAFRYGLAGEFGATAELVRKLRVERRFGLEVGTLGDAYTHAGFAGTAQVDLGTYEHDHRAVGGPTGLSDMSRDVGRALLRIVEENGIEPAYDDLPTAYEAAAATLINQYQADAAHNGLDYDIADERAQVESYREAVSRPGPDDRLPAWEAAPIEPAEVKAASTRALESHGKG